MAKITPYVLPIVTILAVSILLVFARPTITGFFIAPQNSMLNAEIKITADEVLPEDAIIYVYLTDKNISIIEIEKSTIKGFVSKYNMPLSYSAENKGYLGQASITIIKELKDAKKGAYSLETEISYQGVIISETQKEVRI